MNNFKFNKNDLIMNVENKLPYKKITDNFKNLNWGQRKLFFRELEFLTIFWKKEEIPNPIFLYIGAAEGFHIPYLSSLFPEITFHLYDPRPFGIEETDKILIFNDYFTDEIAETYRNNELVLFTSDIRRHNREYYLNELLEKENINIDDNSSKTKQRIKQLKYEAALLLENSIREDMELQMKWFLIINPSHGILKFKLPYIFNSESPRFTNYLKGIVFWQIWNGPFSSETILKPVKNKQGIYEIGEWDNLEYEEICFYHNIVIKAKKRYLNIITNKFEPYSENLINDFDNTAEAYIIAQYINKFNIEIKSIDYFSDKITEVLNQSQNNHKNLEDINNKKLEFYSKLKI